MKGVVLLEDLSKTFRLIKRSEISTKGMELKLNWTNKFMLFPS